MTGTTMWWRATARTAAAALVLGACGGATGTPEPPRLEAADRPDASDDPVPSRMDVVGAFETVVDCERNPVGLLWCDDGTPEGPSAVVEGDADGWCVTVMAVSDIGDTTVPPVPRLARALASTAPDVDRVTVEAMLDEGPDRRRVGQDAAWRHDGDGRTWMFEVGDGYLSLVAADPDVPSEDCGWFDSDLWSAPQWAADTVVGGGEEDATSEEGVGAVDEVAVQALLPPLHEMLESVEGPDRTMLVVSGRRDGEPRVTVTLLAADRGDTVAADRVDLRCGLLTDIEVDTDPEGLFIHCEGGATARFLHVVGVDGLDLAVHPSPSDEDGVAGGWAASSFAVSPAARRLDDVTAVSKVCADTCLDAPLHEFDLRHDEDFPLYQRVACRDADGVEADLDPVNVSVDEVPTLADGCPVGLPGVTAAEEAETVLCAPGHRIPAALHGANDWPAWDAGCPYMPVVGGWLTVLQSLPDSEPRAVAEAAAESWAARTTQDVRVLWTDHYPTLTPGFWAIGIPAPDVDVAEAHVHRIGGDSYSRSLG